MKAETILNHCARKMGVTPESIIKDIQAETKVGTMQEQIEKIVSDEMAVPIEEIKRRSREGIIVISRQLCLYLLRKHLKRLEYKWNRVEKEKQLIEVPESYAQIGAKYSLDHATVIHAVRCISNISEGRDRYTEIVNRIIETTEKQLG
jgi:chromosomal replication initiation ATPase DnaA